MLPQEGYEVSESSFQFFNDPVPTASLHQEIARSLRTGGDVGMIPTLASSSTSCNDLPLISSSASSSSSELRGVQHDVSHRQEQSQARKSHLPSLIDVVQVVTRDFFRQYSCTHPPGFVAAPIHKERQGQQRIDDSRDAEGEGGVEVNEEEILKRDYELSRV